MGEHESGEKITNAGEVSWDLGDDAGVDCRYF